MPLTNKNKVVSSIFVRGTFALVLCEVLRKEAPRRVPVEYHGYMPYIREFIDTLMLCLCVFENGALYQFYGVWAFIAGLTTVGVICRNMFVLTYNNPAEVIVSTLEGKRHYVNALMTISELFACFLLPRFPYSRRA